MANFDVYREYCSRYCVIKKQNGKFAEDCLNNNELEIILNESLYIRRLKKEI